MCNPTGKSLWTQALVLALAVALVASPAMARSRKGHGRHRGHSHGQEWRHADGHHRHYPGCGHGRPVYYRDADDDDADDVFLALGLGALGLTALALFAQPPRPAYGAYGSAPRAAAPVPIDWNAVDEGVTVVSEGYNARGEFCREFQREIEVGGRLERGFGIACLQEDGSWRIGR
jgi:hypothetical protein